MQNVCPINNKILIYKIFNFRPVHADSRGFWMSASEIGRTPLGSSFGWTACQWRNLRGQVDNQILQAQARRLASISTLELETPNCTTGFAQILVAFCALF
jgi:hypothetical protein